MSEVCSECDAPFASAAELVEHVREAHTAAAATPAALENRQRARFLRCALCGARFRSPEALAAHNQVPHPDRRVDLWPRRVTG